MTTDEQAARLSETMASILYGELWQQTHYGTMRVDDARDEIMRWFMSEWFSDRAAVQPDVRPEPVCGVCWTWSWAPCEEGTENAYEDGHGGWMVCQMCNKDEMYRKLAAVQPDALLDQMARIESAIAAFELAAQRADPHWPESGHVHEEGTLSCAATISVDIRRLKRAAEAELAEVRSAYDAAQEQR